MKIPDIILKIKDFELEDNKQVDIAYQKVIELGCEILDKPQIWPDYGDNYYAFFYLDPNVFKMAFVAFE